MRLFTEVITVDYRKTRRYGRSLGRTEATGYGIVYNLRSTENTKYYITKTTATLQGFGNVAEYAARMYNGSVAKSLPFHAGTIKIKAYTYRCRWPDIGALASIKDSYGTV